MTMVIDGRKCKDTLHDSKFLGIILSPHRQLIWNEGKASGPTRSQVPYDMLLFPGASTCSYAESKILRFGRHVFRMFKDAAVEVSIKNGGKLYFKKWYRQEWKNFLSDAHLQILKAFNVYADRVIDWQETRNEGSDLADKIFGKERKHIGQMSRRFKFGLVLRACLQSATKSALSELHQKWADLLEEDKQAFLKFIDQPENLEIADLVGEVCGGKTFTCRWCKREFKSRHGKFCTNCHRFQ